ncbi:MAG: class I SAM-dependent methyltransferase [Candidatus Micrarchaeota archaeon]
MYRKNLLSSLFLKERHKRSLGLLDGIAPRRMLDVGCGEGEFIASFSKRFPSTQIIACDIDPLALSDAGKTCPRAILREGDFSAMDFEPVDLVVMLEVLEHSPDPKAMLAKAAKLAGKNGKILISIPRPELMHWRIIWAFWSSTFGRHWLGQHSHLTEAKLLDIASECGLSPERKAHFFLGSISIILFKPTR